MFVYKLLKEPLVSGSQVQFREKQRSTTWRSNLCVKTAAPVLNLPVCLACGKTACSFLYETVKGTCSYWSEGKIKSNCRTLRLRHRCSTKSCGPVYAKFGEVPLSTQNPELENQMFHCPEWAVFVIETVINGDQSQLTPVYSKFINRVLSYNWCKMEHHEYLCCSSGPRFENKCLVVKSGIAFGLIWNCFDNFQTGPSLKVRLNVKWYKTATVIFRSPLSADWRLDVC